MNLLCSWCMTSATKFWKNDLGEDRTGALLKPYTHEWQVISWVWLKTSESIKFGKAPKSWFGKNCLHTPEKAMASHSSTLAWKIPWTEEPGRLQSGGHKESGTTEQLQFHFSLSCIGEGNGNPLQCSCLENPSDRGAWWAAVYGVAQSWTRVKWLSSSSSSSLHTLAPSAKTCMSAITLCVISTKKNWTLSYKPMYRGIQRLRRFCKITGQVNCGPKTKDFFCAWYSLDIASKGLACSMELKETLFQF